MKVSFTVFGFEVLALRVDRPPPSTQTDHQPPEPPAAQPSAATEPEQFGFYGGSGGTQERAWHPTSRRPIGPNP